MVMVVAACTLYCAGCHYHAYDTRRAGCLARVDDADRPGGRRLLAGGDLDVDRGADFGVQPDPDLVRAHGLDRVANLDPAAVEFGAAGLAHGGRDIRGPDRAEQPAAAARAPAHPHLQALELPGHGLRVLDAADLPGRSGP